MNGDEFDDESQSEVGIMEMPTQEIGLTPDGQSQPPVPVAQAIAPPATNLPPNFGGVRRVSPEEAASGYRAAAQRDRIAQITKQHVQQVEDDKTFTKLMLENTRIQDAQKAIDAAIRFQAMRQFERDLEMGKASGMSPEQSTLQALVRNSGRMFFNNPAAAERGMRSGTGPRVFQAPGVQPFAVGPSGTPARLAVPPAGVRAYRTPSGREFATYGTQMRVLAPDRGDGMTKSQQLSYLRRQQAKAEESLEFPPMGMTKDETADLKARADQYRLSADELEQELFGASGAGVAATQRGPIAPPSGVDLAAPAPQPTRKPAQLSVGQVYKGYRYNGKYPPSDRRSWDKVQ